MTNKRTIILVTFLVAVLISIFTPNFCVKKEKEYRETVYNNKNNFIYFSQFNSKIFEHSKGCNCWEAENTLKGRFSFSCKFTIQDSLVSHETEFWDSLDRNRIQNFMTDISLQNILFYRDSVKFVFIDGVTLLSKNRIKRYDLDNASLDSLLTIRF
ncbi:hypothetical protein CJD36_003905 [Flavipsychrobacter stenotrophus]|uniref:Uncharacterized protein n=1 Tax=Flavipsychrobacter stenotrophus TaxID=2077091 RepID=A0A2S7T115_9BACT|nr:hypothetical protein [Flavipsychrobacter stenotrophus]PQJ12899.1 hypothetical protein CJD36_003905 [Flavipsychrobacter stenotrophus]